jgi:hypothetical protein
MKAIKGRSVTRHSQVSGHNHGRLYGSQADVGGVRQPTVPELLL